MSTIFLKVKIKSLAVESRIIRKEEHLIYANRTARKKWRRIKLGLDTEDKRPSVTMLDNVKLPRSHSEANRDLFFNLQAHRKFVVRPEARATQLAYAFLRGKSYADTEKVDWKVRGNPYDWAERKVYDSVVRMVIKYGPKQISPMETAQAVWDWLGHRMPTRYEDILKRMTF